jgi:hypothetical protein
MCKKNLQERQMTEAVYVDEVASWARWLTQREARGPGDIENAWRRLEHRHGIPWRIFWALRYRPPKQIAASLYFGMKGAWEAERDRQLRLLRHETEITKATTGPDHPAVRAAEALVSENDDEK